MTERSNSKLIPLDETGAYCDPETGECATFDSQEETMTFFFIYLSEIYENIIVYQNSFCQSLSFRT
ncbi:MAG: hypothetical protein CVU43_12640 [Chloroflexi bacterium HGW-Chloroflexi-5]|jgi:hypothetical protein|nr:MAG: hypothetical protein CVU43_12640 [Chloroflexi bacterium HGW-Chloroflexi-5]